MHVIEDRKKRIIYLYFNQHKTYSEIAQIERISPRDINAIIKEELTRRQKYKDQQQSAEVYRLFSEGKTRVQVAIELNLPASKVSKLCIEYWKLRGLDKLYTIYKETNGKLGPFLKLYKELIKNRGMTIEQVVNVVDIAIDKLPYMESLYEQVKEQVEKMQRTRQGLVNDIEATKYKISILDATAFFCEQVRRRKQQEIQELIAQKNRIERLIANILNEEGNSKLKQIVKENIKAILFDNKILISLSLTALILTIKTNPEMINVIHKMATTNDLEQKDGNNNLTKYLESNMHTLLALSEKNYENLVEVLTNNVIYTAAPSSNPTLSSPQSSSSFPSASNQSHTNRKEESDIYHNSEGDIVD